MAATTEELIDIARACADVATKLKQAKYIADQTIARNLVEAFDWGGVDAATGNTALSGAGISYTSEEIANAIGSLSAFQTWWSANGGNLEKLVDPIV